MKIRRLQKYAPEFQQQLSGLLSQSEEPDPTVLATVTEILNRIREQGDTALLEYTNRFDRRNATIEELEITTERMTEALATIADPLRQGLESAARRIRQFHAKQKAKSWTYEDEDGTLLGQHVTPLDRVGVYVPGGKAAYPSSVLMNVIPAVVAGVKEIIMMVPAPDGELNDLVLAAAKIAGVSRIFSVGGAQAVASLAYGTKTIPKVDKIVGPGNIYVATAKRMVFGRVGIDMIAGPSEVLIVCDGATSPDWVAMDLFAQAEHDEDASAILISTDSGFLDAVEKSIETLLPQMERAAIIQQALAQNGALIEVDTLNEAAEIVNQIAPEHLELSLSDPMAFLKTVRHAGAIFMGRYTAEVFGDYCAGPNHVLPTARTARFSSPLGVHDFQKHASLIMCSEASASGLAVTASILARGEGLTAHARSAEYRIGEK